MLVLSRRLGETLIIGDNIKVTVLGISGNQVRLGIAAPETVSVHREEVYHRIHGEPKPIDPTPVAETAQQQPRRTQFGARSFRAGN